MDKPAENPIIDDESKQPKKLFEGHIHKKAVELLTDLENLIKKEENSDKILTRLYEEANYFGGGSKILKRFRYMIYLLMINLETEKKKIFRQFKILLFFEDVYRGEYLTNFGTKEELEIHEKHFGEGVNYAYSLSKEDDTNIREILEEAYMTYINPNNIKK